MVKNGGGIVTTKWADADKGGEYRCRLVGRELAREKRLGLYVATPPLEVIRMFLAKCAMGQDRAKPLRIGIVDVRRAYFSARAQRPVYIEIPLEDMEPGDAGKVARLDMSLGRWIELAPRRRMGPGALD